MLAIHDTYRNGHVCHKVTEI